MIEFRMSKEEIKIGMESNVIDLLAIVPTNEVKEKGTPCVKSAMKEKNNTHNNVVEDKNKDRQAKGEKKYVV